MDSKKEDKVRRYVISMIFHRLNSALKSKNIFNSQVIVIKGLGSFVVGDLKTVKRYKKTIYGFSRKTIKKAKRIARNKVPNELEKLL